jgi:hypothetical protein
MSRSVFRWAMALAIVAGGSPLVCAQFQEASSDNGVRFGESTTHKYQAGVVIKAVGGSCKGLFATVPVPLVWPEQDVQVIEEDTSPEVKRIRYRSIDGAVRQMLVDIPRLPAGSEAHALVTFEIHRRAILAPAETSDLRIPKRVGRAVKRYLGSSPYIESRNAKIRALAKEITADQPTAWAKVEAIYDYVRAHVDYRNGPLKGALKALQDGYGDCEELSSLFIALCRAAGVPARTVWIPDHCYPEFYLVDGTGKGHWFPCQAAGTRAFGEMPEQRPILQKGDSFRVPEKPRERQRYVAEFLRGAPAKGGGQPKVRFIREVLE